VTPYRLDQKIAVVTGASSGIGRAIARLFAMQGAGVVANYHRSQEQAELLCAEIREAGREARAIQADVSSAADVERLVEATLTAFGRIDIWANMAGADILTGSGAALCDNDKLERLIAVDLKGTIQCSWCVAPIMKATGSGVILNMSGSMSWRPAGSAPRSPTR
jgi:NAD(P)-dependent dehydrogenase (short-subunit alcohol dehydrogenase family)